MIGKIEQLTTTVEGPMDLAVKAIRPIKKLDIDPDTLLIALEFKIGKSIQTLATEYHLPVEEIE